MVGLCLVDCDLLWDILGLSWMCFIWLIVCTSLIGRNSSSRASSFDSGYFPLWNTCPPVAFQMKWRKKTKVVCENVLLLYLLWIWFILQIGIYTHLMLLLLSFKLQVARRPNRNTGVASTAFEASHFGCKHWGSWCGIEREKKSPGKKSLAQTGP